MLNGAFDNIKRILFASDRVTDMEMRNAILNGEVDDLPEQAFLNVGTIEDAKEKAKKLLAAANV